MASENSQISVYYWTSVPANYRQSYRFTISVDASTTVQDFYTQVATETGSRGTGMSLWKPSPCFTTDYMTFWEAVDNANHPSEIATDMCAETDDTFYDALGTNVFVDSVSTIHAIVLWQGNPVVAPPLILKPLRSPVIQKDWYQREKTVETIFKKLEAQCMIQVRGPSASGKTVLLNLLHACILKNVPEAEVYVFNKWPEPKDENIYSSFLEDEVRRLTIGNNDGLRRYLLFDEGQSTDWDHDFFWGQVIKRLDQMDRYRIVLFCKYAPPGTAKHGGPELEDVHNLNLHAVIPPVIVSGQKVSLRAVDNDQCHHPIGLLLNRTEFEEAVKLQEGGATLVPGVVEELFRWTLGHVGVMADLLSIIGSKSNGVKRDQQACFTLENLRETFPVRGIKSFLLKMPNLLRGTPPAQTLKDNDAMNHVFLEVLSRGSVRKLDFDNPEEQRALRECYEQGWLHADALEWSHPLYQTYGARPFYSFPSPLHAVYISHILHPTEGNPPQKTLLQFVAAVIKGFSPSRLNPSTACRMGVAFYERTPESRYRDEFYRTANAVTAGAVQLCPEFVSARKDRRIDFFVGSKGWGIEVMRNGDRLAAAQNFGDYAAWLKELQLEDSILLDFRTTRPTQSHSDVHNLYHVVFAEDFRSFEMLDCRLKEVDRADLVEMQRNQGDGGGSNEIR